MNVWRWVYRWRGLLYLICSLSAGTLLVLRVTERSSSSLFGGTSSSIMDRAKNRVSSPQRFHLRLSSRHRQVKEGGLASQLDHLQEMLQFLPLTAFVMEKDFLSCLAAFSQIIGGGFCLGILLEKDLLHFGVVVPSWETVEQVINKTTEGRTGRFCIVRDVCSEAHFEAVEEMHAAAVIMQVGGQMKNHPLTIHLSILHEVAGSFWMSCPTSNQSSSQCNESSHDSLHPFSSFLTIPHSGNIFNKFRLEGIQSEILRTPMLLPAEPSIFLQRLDSSHFIPCNRSSAASFNARRTVNLPSSSPEEELFRTRVRNLLTRVQRILEEIDVPWWISSGTCLGWYRQCDIIPYSQDVDIGMWIKDFTPRLIPLMEERGLELVYRLGKVNDSLQLSFVYKETKLDIYFFYEERDHMWNGATAYHAGQKFKYIFPKFTICRSIFLGVVVRVPCQALEYITANYGINWTVPINHWDWRNSPPNSQLNGFWSQEERQEAIYLNLRYYNNSLTVEDGEYGRSSAEFPATATLERDRSPAP